MWLLIVTYLILVFALPLALSAAVSYRGLPLGRSCPQCASETLQVLVPGLRRVAMFVPGLSLQRRWCLACRWEGLVRTSRVPTADEVARNGFVQADKTPMEPGGEPRPARELVRPGGRRATPDGTSQTLDVRSLNLNGAAWRVMLQCWHGTERCYGRFVFVAPSGRLWMDSMEALSGTTEDDVLGQALSLPDVLLARRLRRLVVDY